jgi:hypothetical protein
MLLPASFPVVECSLQALMPKGKLFDKPSMLDEHRTHHYGTGISIDPDRISQFRTAAWPSSKRAPC